MKVKVNTNIFLIFGKVGTIYHIIRIYKLKARILEERKANVTALWVKKSTFQNNLKVHRDT